MNFIDDHAAHRLEHIAAGFRGQQDEQRFRGGHEYVRRTALHERTFRLRGIAGTHLRTNRHIRIAVFEQGVANAVQRQLEVLMNIIGKSFQRRDVKHPDLIRERKLQTLVHELVDRCQECGQRLAGTGGRRDQRISPCLYRRPGLGLNLRGCTEMRGKPVRNSRVELK